jgi:hypothetical protein
VGGGDHAHVHADQFAAADAEELALGQHPQQRVCSAAGMSPISSRNSVPPSACSKRPTWRLARR